jgi:hypothetical protein
VLSSAVERLVGERRSQIKCCERRGKEQMRRRTSGASKAVFTLHVTCCGDESWRLTGKLTRAVRMQSSVARCRADATAQGHELRASNDSRIFDQA